MSHPETMSGICAAVEGVQDGAPAKRQPSGGASDAVLETQSRQGGS